MIDEPHLTEWDGIPIKVFPMEETPDYANTIYRLAYDWDVEVPLTQQLDRFFSNPECSETKGITLGLNTDEASDFHSDANARIILEKDNLPKLRFLFLGEMLGEESELSWIGQSDVGAPVLEAFPGLEELRARGGVDYGDEFLNFSSCRHICLQRLTLQTVGLRQSAIQGLTNSVLPELEYLELWLGAEDRERTCTVDDVKTFLDTNPFPKLTHLGLNNCDIITEIAPIIASSPILSQIKSLDLSGGTLQDSGAQALLDSDLVKGLERLDLHHHYLSNEMMAKFEALDLEVDVSDQNASDSDGDDEEYFYVSVSE